MYELCHELTNYEAELFIEAIFWLTSIPAFYWDLAIVNLCSQSWVVFHLGSCVRVCVCLWASSVSPEPSPSLSSIPNNTLWSLIQSLQLFLASYFLLLRCLLHFFYLNDLRFYIRFERCELRPWYRRIWSFFHFHLHSSLFLIIGRGGRISSRKVSAYGWKFSVPLRQWQK